MKPGRMVTPARSMTWASAGIVTSSRGPTDTMVSPCITRIPSRIGPAPVPSISVPVRARAGASMVAGPSSDVTEAAEVDVTGSAGADVIEVGGVPGSPALG